MKRISIMKLISILGRNKRKTFGLLINLMAGLLSGICISLTSSYFVFPIDIQWLTGIIILFIFYIFFYPLGLFLVSWSTRKDPIEIYSYKTNLVGASVASFIAILLINAKGNIFTILSVSLLAVVFIIILAYLWAKKKA